jgi:hypothetical protein
VQPALPVGRHPVRKVLDAAHEYLGVVRLAALAPTLASGPRDGQDGAKECQVEEDGSVGRDLERQERGRVEDCQEEEDGCERAGDERDETAAAPNRKTSARGGYRRARGQGTHRMTSVIRSLGNWSTYLRAIGREPASRRSKRCGSSLYSRKSHRAWGV